MVDRIDAEHLIGLPGAAHHDAVVGGVTPALSLTNHLKSSNDSEIVPRKEIPVREKCWVALTALGLVVTAAAADPPAGAVIEYQGLCNASAAVALDGDRFVVADDEDKPKTFLRV